MDLPRYGALVDGVRHYDVELEDRPDTRGTNAIFVQDTILVQFGPDTGKDPRRVVVNGQVEFFLAPGRSTNLVHQNVRICAEGASLKINDIPVNFMGEDLSPPAKLALIKKLYPGVTFIGLPLGVVIDSKVAIGAGAEIELTPGLRLTGNSVVRGTARISGGSFKDSVVSGWVTGGSFTQSSVARGAFVSGGVIRGSEIGEACRVTGGTLIDCRLKTRAQVSGGEFSRCTFEIGARVSNGERTGRVIGEVLVPVAKATRR